MRRNSDFGGQPLRRGRTLPFAIAAIVSATPLLAVTIKHDLSALARQRNAAQALTRALNLPGPACPEITEPEFLARRRPLKNVFNFSGVRFARRFGHADCMMIGLYEPGAGDGYPACRFTAPAVLHVAPAEGPTRIFDVGVGRRAIVTVRGGEPRCVLAAPSP